MTSSSSPRLASTRSEMLAWITLACMAHLSLPIWRLTSVTGLAARSNLEADDSLATQAASAEVVQYLRGVGECGGGTDTCGNRAVREHLSDRVQSLRRYQGILTGGMVVRGDVTLREPAFVRSEDGRYQLPAAPDDLGVAANGVRAIDQVEDGIDTVGVIGVKRIDYVNGLAVVHLFGSKTTRLVGVASHGRDDMCPAGMAHLPRVAAAPAGRAHHDDVLACCDLEQLKRPQRRDRRMGSAAAWSSATP